MAVIVLASTLEQFAGSPALLTALGWLGARWEGAPSVRMLGYMERGKEGTIFQPPQLDLEVKSSPSAYGRCSP